MSVNRNSRIPSAFWRGALGALGAAAGVCLAVSTLAPVQAATGGLSDLPPAQQNEVLGEAGLTPAEVQHRQSLEQLAQAADTDFYATPTQLPAADGDVVRQETIALPAQKADAQRIMYRTTDAAGQPVAVTGTVLVSKDPWQKPGPRPLVVSAPGTQGMGDQCAPSRQLAQGADYDAAWLSALLTGGYSVVIPDYVGMGTEGTHTYMNRLDQAHAVLDAARAAQRVGIAGIGAATPVALVGYSQGGGATAAAAETASEYAPELNIKNAWVGAPPADLVATGQRIDAGLFSGLALYTFAAAEEYGVPVRETLNADGVARLDRAKEECSMDTVINDAFVPSRTLTKDGRSFTELSAEPPVAGYLGEQKIGAQGRHPGIPVRIAHSAGDDVVPYRAGRELAQRWCGSGSNVSFQTLLTPTHAGAAMEGTYSMIGFLDARFSGIPQLSSCWRL